MTSLYDDTELPMRITHSFPPRGIVAKVLTNSQNTKDSSLYLYGSFKEHSIPNSRTKKRNEDATFSLPQTLTEKTYETRKTPRFYTVDTSSLRQQGNKVDQALNQLITNSDLTGLQEIYQRICKGSVTTLQTLISRKKISQKFVYFQNSSPLTRYHHKTRRISTAKEQEPQKISDDHQHVQYSDSQTTSQKINKRVLVPSPYFNRKHNDTTSLSDTSSQHILYSSKFDKNYINANKHPIEPTVINLNYKLPELPNNRRPNTRFHNIKKLNAAEKQRWGSSVIKTSDSDEKRRTAHTINVANFTKTK